MGDETERLEQRLEEIRKRFQERLAQVSSEEGFEEIRIQLLGRKRGELTQIIRAVAALPQTDRPRVGQQANQLKRLVQKELNKKRANLESQAFEEGLVDARIDVTLPGTRALSGSLHPLTRVRQELEEIFLQMGYSIEHGPEVEDDFHNFEALNIPAGHPARDMFDTFYVDHDYLLRSHTSPVQIRTMQAKAPPLRIIAPGKVYRRDYDVSHTPMFFQIEGLVVDENITFQHLKGTLECFLHRFFDEKTEIRFRPSYFPFTEPSAEVDIRCIICGGKGCRVCSEKGWLEVLGSGMVDPAVFEFVGYDPERYTGFAFGLGVDRMTMLKYRIADIRGFYENDIRLLRQFTL